ncbi:hypothetical protein LDENG_00177540, partial [Lucifuga dentata]
MEAPSGFIIQLSFLDFELEEALGCIYDQVMVNTGNAEVKLCGLTANGLTLNSTGNVMELSFISDFSVQKKGFRVSFHHVAVALRNQKITIVTGAAKVTSSISIPTLSHLTVCFEIARGVSQKQKETIFTYYDGSNNTVLSFGSDQHGMKLNADGVACSIESIITSADFISSMKKYCVTWTSSTGRVAVYFNNNYLATTCSTSAGHSVPAGGVFRLGGQHSFEGNVYNFRLWDYAMTVQQLNTLTCDTVGNIIDWVNSYWDISPSLAQTDSTLSCICYPHCIHLTTAAPNSGTSLPSYTTHSTSCDSPGLGCPASSSSTIPSTDSTNTIHATNANTHVLPSISPSPSSIPTTSIPLSPTTSTSSSSSSVMPPSTIITTTNAAPSASPATNTASATSMANAQQPTSDTPTSATTNHPTTNPTVHEGLFYRISFVVEDEGSELAEADVQKTVLHWLNQTFENWTHTVYVDYIRVQPDLPNGGDTTSYTCQALLVYYYNTNESLGEAAVSARLFNSVAPMGGGLQILSTSIHVKSVENCPEENPLHYRWPESRPTVTQYLPCFPNKDQRTSRTCLISPQNYSSYWSAPDLSNCTDIDTIEVSAENAAEVAEHLADITNNELSNEEVSKVVTKVQELVNVAKINATLASTVVTIISNVMTSSETALAAASEKALKTVDELVQKIEFEGPSVSITSRHLALGISALNTSMFNGTSFTAFISSNTTEPQVQSE